MNDSVPTAVTAAPRRPWAARLLGGALGPLAGLALVIVLFAAAERYQGGNNFLTARNFRTVAVQTAAVAVAALGMTVVIIAGGIDLSAGTSLALCATVIAVVLRAGYSPWLGVTAGILTGCLAGLINGVLISLLRVVPFIVTLGTMTAYLGIAKLLAQETTVRPLPAQVPAWIREQLLATLPAWPWLVDLDLGLGRLQVPNVAAGVWMVLMLAALLSAVLRYTVFGRYVFALGSNEATARLCGIPLAPMKVAVYTLSGFFVGVAGLYQFARLSSGNPTSGAGLELKVIAAVVIGGGSLSGGQGTVLGTLTGAAIMGVIASGCTLLGLSNPLQDILIGVMIVAAVTLDQLRQRRLAS